MEQQPDLRSDALTAIHNYRPLDRTLSTSGQPTVAQLTKIAEAGSTTVINLALHDDPRYSLPDEPGTVNALGLHYIHIPVQFAAPTMSDLQKFFAALDAHQGENLWIHCAANYRVAVFLGLYRVLRQGWEPAAAFQLLDSLWQPNEVWSTFIANALCAPTAAGSQ